MMRPQSVRSIFALLVACLAVTTSSAQTEPPPSQLKVFRGTLVHSRVRTEMEVLQDHLIGFEENNFGRIVFVRPASELGSLAQQHGFNQNDVVTLTDSQFLMPGLVDCHTHASTQYFRAGADFQGFLDFILNTLIPGDVMFSNTTYAREQSMKVVRRTLQFGTTTISHNGATSVNGTIELVRVINEFGQRAIVQVASFDMLPGPLAPLIPPSFRPLTTDEALSGATRFIELVRELENPLIRPSVGPELTSTSTPELIQGLGAIANATGVFVQAHFGGEFPELNTTLPEWEAVGLLPVNQTLIAHGIFLRESEMETFRRRGISIAHCPSGSLKLGNGILDVRRMLDFGINVCLGTDVAAGHSSSILNEMRIALHASQALSLNLTMNLPAGYAPLSLAEGFYMATMGGAQANGLGDTVGNFEAGKQFDALLIDISAPSASDPVFDTTSSDTTNVRIEKFLYLGDDRNIQNVYVAGRLRFSQDGLSSDLPIRISLVNNSPMIVGSSVSVDVGISKPTQSLTCHLRGVSGVGREFSDEQDCSSLNVMYPNLNAGKYVLRVVGNAVTGERAVIRRDFRIGGSSVDCTVNLINRGIVVRGNTVSIQFAVNGEASSHTCRMDRQQTSQCESPVTYSGLSSGEHSFQVTPQGCTGESSYRLSAKFTVP